MHDVSLAPVTSGCLCPPMLWGRLEMKGQPLPAPLPRCPLIHQATLAALAGSPNLVRMLVHSWACVCPLLDKLTMGNHWHNHPMRVEMEPQSRTWSCSPSPAFSVPRRPNTSWSLSERCWMLQHLQDAGFCSWLSEAGSFLQFLHRLLRETCLQKGDLGPYPYSGLLLS